MGGRGAGPLPAVGNYDSAKRREVAGTTTWTVIKRLVPPVVYRVQEEKEGLSVSAAAFRGV